MTTHSSILAWETLCTEEPGSCRKAGHDYMAERSSSWIVKYYECFGVQNVRMQTHKACVLTVRRRALGALGKNEGPCRP